MENWTGRILSGQYGRPFNATLKTRMNSISSNLYTPFSTQFDIDYGVSLNWPTILQAKIMRESGYNRWVGHDMQPRPEDDEERGVERIRQSILSWSSCWDISKKIEMGKLLNFASKRDTISIEKEARKYIHLANIQLADMDTLYP